MKVILFGATGMVGQGCLRECLLDPLVESERTSDVQLHIGEARDSGSGPEPVIGRRERRPVGTIPE